MFVFEAENGIVEARLLLDDSINPRAVERRFPVRYDPDAPTEHFSTPYGRRLGMTQRMGIAVVIVSCVAGAPALNDLAGSPLSPRPWRRTR